MLAFAVSPCNEKIFLFHKAQEKWVLSHTLVEVPAAVGVSLVTGQ